MEVCCSRKGSRIRVSPAQMVPTSESEAHRWGTDPDPGEIWSVLKSDEAKLTLIPGPEFPIWVGCRCSLLAQSLPRRSPLLPFGAPMPCAAGSSKTLPAGPSSPHTHTLLPIPQNIKRQCFLYQQSNAVLSSCCSKGGGFFLCDLQDPPLNYSRFVKKKRP